MLKNNIVTSMKMINKWTSLNKKCFSLRSQVQVFQVFQTSNFSLRLKTFNFALFTAMKLTVKRLGVVVLVLFMLGAALQLALSSHAHTEAERGERPGSSAKDRLARVAVAQSADIASPAVRVPPRRIATSCAYPFVLAILLCVRTRTSLLVWCVVRCSRRGAVSCRGQRCRVCAAHRALHVGVWRRGRYCEPRHPEPILHRAPPHAA